MTSTDPCQVQFADFDRVMFLRDYWQKKPLLIRNPWTDWHNPLDPDELAGLACESEVESRLVTQGEGNWALEQGPYRPARFGKLGKAPWTLLVQAVDHHDPRVAALIEPFRFIPDWRIDDVMVSYADDGGGVGPHFDNYDVFLVQGLGRRRWQIGARCDESSALLPHDDLRLLADFEPLEEWVLDPGDMLYVPPGVAHNGVAVGDRCMTYSIGFRAPSRGELVAGWTESVLSLLDEDDRYADPDLAQQENPGEIGGAALDRVQAMILESLGDRAQFARWFGQFSTTPKYPEIDWRPEEAHDAADVAQLLAEGHALERNPASRFAFVRSDPLSLFVDGECHACSGEAAAFAEQLCARRDLIRGAGLAASEHVVALVTHLLNAGAIAFAADD